MDPLNLADKKNAEADALPALHPVSLRFVDEDWDDRYRAAIREGNLITLRTALWIAMALNTLFVPQDLAFFPEHSTLIAIVRGVVVNGFMLLCIAASHATYWRTRWPGLLMMVAIVYAIFQGWANVYGASPEPLDSGFVLLIFVIYALLPFFYIQAVYTALICTVLFIAVTLIFAWPPADTGKALNTIMLMATANVIGFVALRRIELLRRRDFANREMIEGERARFKTLLERILPTSVAERLENGEDRVVEQLADVTVLFADVEGFTAMSADCAPEQTLDILSTTFGRFDKLVAQHGVEKIKTIGDAYMVAAGAPTGAGTDARHIADLALDMVASMDGLARPDGTPLHIRIGVARGPIIGGVVGDSRFLYDLWGDAVNTAARLEATSAPERIQVTESVVEALGDRYRFEPLGEVEIKGKGRMPTWWLLGPSDPPAVAAE